MSELSPKDLVKKYLAETLIMQLATSVNGQPWICNLHFITDAASNIYWISKTNRRHSQEIATNPHTAIAIAVQTEKPLVGVQAEGTTEIVTNTDDVRAIMGLYMERHGTDSAFVETIINGTNEHKLYVFRPTRFSLFDQANFAEQPSQEWVLDTK